MSKDSKKASVMTVKWMWVESRRKITEETQSGHTGPCIVIGRTGFYSE